MRLSCSLLLLSRQLGDASGHEITPNVLKYLAMILAHHAATARSLEQKIPDAAGPQEPMAETSHNVIPFPLPRSRLDRGGAA